jgi:digeranylgeranylglycerophospholipid reductase
VFEDLNDVDVVVVGAGPGGSATAKRCAELGLKTVMLEKRLSIGSEKRCGEGLSADAIEKLGQKIPRYCIMQTINGSLVYAPNGKKITIDFGKTAGYVLERKQYDKWLAEEAARAGARVQAKTYVTGVRKEKLTRNSRAKNSR